MIKLKEIFRLNEAFSVRERMINPEHVITMFTDSAMKSNLNEGRLSRLELDVRAEFVRIELIENHRITVVGSLSEIQSQIFKTKKLLLG